MKLSPWLDTLLPTEWTVPAYTSAEHTEVYRHRPDSDYDLLRDVALGNTGHVRVLALPVAIVDTLPEGILLLHWVNAAKVDRVESTCRNA